MAWPLSQDYNEALQNPHTNFSDPELRGGKVVTNVLGIPQPCSGNFADVYAVECPRTGAKWAVKCFTREVRGLSERYAEISKHLQRARLPFTVDFQYLQQGVRVAGRWYPALKMHWVEGLTLNAFVREALDRPAALDALAQIWLRMARRLREAELTHCDLQHGNVLLVPGSTASSLAVKLIDYDGMWVPALARAPSGEVGHPAYQHPRRLRQGTYNREVDRFPLLVVATALRCLRVGGRALWQHHDTGDNLLFREADLRAPAQSALFRELRQLDDSLARSLVDHLARAAQMPLEQTPLLEAVFLEEKPSTSAVTHGKPQPVPPSAPHNAFEEIGEARGRRYRRRAARHEGASAVAWAVGGLLAACAVAAGVLLWTRVPDLKGLEQPEPAVAGRNAREHSVKDSGTRVKPKEKPKGKGKRPSGPRSGDHPAAFVGPLPEPNPKTTPPEKGKPPVTNPVPKPKDPEAEKVEAALKRFREMLRAPGADPDEVRRKLVAFRRERAGTPAALGAGRLLSQIPSPLDRLSAGGIPEPERVPGMPPELVAVLGERRGRHGGFVRPVVCSSDGKTVVSGGTGLVRIWDADTLRLRSTLPFTGSFVLDVALARDSRTLAVGQARPGTGDVQVWDIADKDKPDLRFTIPLGNSQVWSAALTPDAKTLAVGCSGGSIHLFDIAGQQPKELTVLRRHAGNVRALVFSPDGKSLASGGAKTARVWAIDGAKTREGPALPDSGGAVLALAFAPDGKTLASGGTDNALRLWTVSARPQQLRFPPLNAGWVYALSFSKDGKTLAAACGGGPGSKHGTIRLLTVGNGPPRPKSGLRGPLGGAFAVAFAPDGKTLFTGGNDWVVRSWDLTRKEPKERAEPLGHLSLPRAAAFAPDGKALVTGGEDRTVRLWDLTRTPPRPRTLLAGGSGVVRSVAYSPDGSLVAAGCDDGSLHQWDAATGRSDKLWKGLPGPVIAVAYLPDGKRLLLASGKDVILWDAATGKEVRRFKGHQTNVTCLALSPDGRRALCGSGAEKEKGKGVYTDCAMRLWDVEAGEELYVDNSNPKPLSSVAFSADGRQAFSAASEPQIRRWDLSGSQPTELPALKKDPGLPMQMWATPDGGRLVVFDGHLVVWDLATGKNVRQWEFFEELVGTLALSAEGRHVAVSFSSGLVCILRLAASGPEK